MKTRQLITRYTWLAALLSMGCLNIQYTQAADISLSDAPLFLVTSAEANVFFIYDNSGSMNVEMMMNNNNVSGWGGVVSSGQRNLYGDGINSSGSTVTINGNAVVNTSNFATAFSHSYNTLYYDPTRTYEAWPGYESISNPPAAARIDPANATDVVDLTANWTWTVGTSVTRSPLFYYDSGGTLQTITNTNNFSYIGTDGITYSFQDRQNFANWFTYHRRREYAAKFAVAKIINNATGSLRVGFAPINPTVQDNSNNNIAISVSQPLISITKNKTFTAGIDDGITNRNTVRDNLYDVVTNGSTPLRYAFQRTGNYFECTGTADTPFVTSYTSGSITFNTTACAVQNAGLNPPGQCQQNFAVFVTDGEYNDTGFSRSDDDDNDGTTTSLTYYPNGITTTSNFKFDESPYGTSNTSTLSDLAMNFYERDLHSSVENRVPTQCNVDENPAQHLVTYAVSFGIPASRVAPTTHNPVLTSCPVISPAITGPYTTTGTATTWNDSSEINDLVHATYNGRGKYYDAANPLALVNNLQSVLSDLTNRRGAAAAVGLNSTSNTSNTRVYISLFNSGSWFGELSAYTLNADGTLPATPTWSAHSWIDNLPNDTGATGTAVTDRVIPDRAIITFNPSAVTAPYAEPFIWDNLDTTQRDDLRTDSGGTVVANDAMAQKRLNYIRGDHRCEFGFTSTATQYCTSSTPASDAKYFRTRTKSAGTFFRTGDFINSSPVYVGGAVGTYPSNGDFPSTTGNTYQDFKNGAATASNGFTTTGKNTTNRTPMIYVGGNDGMLHAFNASNGEEVFAYIPNAVYAAGTNTAGLHKLTEQGAHISYVDQTPTIADAFITKPGDTIAKWRTVLVGALRNGGKGIFALDVTDPDHIIGGGSGATREAEAAEHVMWEYPKPGVTENDLGYTYSQPVIVPLRTGASSIDWFAVFGNGYNSTNGHAVLYVVKLSGPGSDNIWDLSGAGQEVYKLDTGVGVPLSDNSTRSNGLSSPAVVDTDSDGVFDRAYAGDLYGNMWAFDLSGNSPGSWDVDYKSGTTPLPLFTQDATGSTFDSALGKDKPITAKPVVIRNARQTTNSGNTPNVIVLFGTGKYLASGDQNDTTSHSFYGVWDEGTNSLDPTDLIAQTITTTGSTRTLSSNNVDYSLSTVFGWRMDLTESGERSVTKATLLGNTLLFPTITPTSAPCGGGGTSWLMAVSPFDGRAPGIPTFDVNGDGIITITENTVSSSMVAGIRDLNMTPEYAYVSGPATPPNTTPPCASGSYVQGIGTTTTAGTTSHGICAEGGSGKAGRYSWRQLKFNN